MKIADILKLFGKSMGENDLSTSLRDKIITTLVSELYPNDLGKKQLAAKIMADAYMDGTMLSALKEINLDNIDSDLDGIDLDLSKV